MWEWLDNAIAAAKSALGFGDTPEPTTPCPLLNTALVVVVIRKDNNKPVENATVNITGPTPGGKPTDKQGLARFKPVDPGTYDIDVTIPENIKDEYEPPQTEQEGVSEGACSTHIVYITPLVNVATPEIKTDREEVRGKFTAAKDEEKEIHFFQPEKKESKDEPEVVEVKLTYKETRPAIAFDKGGTLTLAGEAATLWEDRECKKPVTVPLALRNGQLKSGHTLYLRRDGSGDATLSLKLEATQKERITLEGPVEKKVKVKPVNRVTPYIKVEHLVVLRDQDLCTKQTKNDKLAGTAAEPADYIRADPTRIELSGAQTAEDPAYTGKGTLSFSPENVKVFEDEACEKEFKLSDKIDFAKLTTAGPLKLWLRGKTAGKFTAKLELEASNDPNIKVDEPAKGEMGCVELKLKLHHYKKDDVNKAINPDVKKASPPADDPDNGMDPSKFWDELKALTFEQTKMEDADRVGTGRMLHVQKDKNNGRAKLIVEKVDASHWPDAAKDYQIILDAADGDIRNKKRSGAVKLFTLEEEGDDKGVRQELPLADMKAAEKTFWVEGATACDKWRDLRLSLGFDRPAGGPEKTVKMDGDWAAFSVVEISEIKIDYTPEPDKPLIWDKDKGRFFINYKADPDGRKVTIGAKFSKPLKGALLHLMLAPDKDNLKADTSTSVGEATVEQHRDDRKKLLHLTAETDADGYAKVELKTSRFGGDKFQPASYILQDPHLARYIQNHADLSKRKPVVADKIMEIWRKLYCQVTAIDGMSVPSLGDAQSAFELVYVDFEEDTAARVMLTEGTAPAGSIVDGSVIKSGYPAKSLVVGTHNVASFKPKFNAKFRTKNLPAAHIIFCHEQLDGAASPYDAVLPAVGAGDCTAASDIYTYKLASSEAGEDALFFPKNFKDGSDAVSKCEWECVEDPLKKGSIAVSNLSFAADRTSVSIQFPAEASLLLKGGKTMKLTVKIAYAEGWYNGWCTSGDRHNVIKTQGRSARGMCCTIVHECGHAINQAPKEAAPFPGLKAPPHGRYYTNSRGHLGPHCADGIDDTYYNNASNRMDTSHASAACTCIMYGSGSDARNANGKFCAKCKPYLLGVGIVQVTA